MTLEQMAQIIATGDVPLSIRMSQNNNDLGSVRRALDARKSGRYDGMTYEQVLARLRSNLDAANRTEAE